MSPKLSQMPHTMQWQILQAMYQCHYKAWLLAKEEHPEVLSLNNNEITFPFPRILAQDKYILAAWYTEQIDTTDYGNIVQIKYGKEQTQTFRLSSYTAKAQKLLEDTSALVNQKEPPGFYKNRHCSECPFWNHCHPKLKEKDCISLLGGISPKAISTYHSRGIFTITQLSYLFRPKRHRLKLPEGKMIWELKALALREKKTFVLQTPELPQNDTAIYLDFEGLPKQNFYYLFGCLIKEEDKEDKALSFWCDDQQNEEEQFLKLIAVLNQYPEAPVYHYGSYESTALKAAGKKYQGIIKENLPAIEKRMINLLSFLRTNVYSPTYTNGLKEIAGSLGFKWSDESANGLQSITWRKEWEGAKNNTWKERLVQYNQDDCKALVIVYEWFRELFSDSTKDNVQMVSKMRKHTPYKLQNNPDYSEDFQYINKAAYFDYQHSKIYWRNENTVAPFKKRTTHFGKGHPFWQPKKVNEIIQLPALKRCPHCGHKKLYHASKQRTYLQTDLKFTPSGIKQWNLEYHAGKGTCAKCRMKYNDVVLRRLQFGDNLFAWTVNLYVNYQLSFSMISRMLQEHFGIWANPTYFNERNYYWWQQFKPEVDYCWKIIFNSPVIHIDETPVRLSKGKDKGYVWVFATPHTVFYHLTLTRESAYLQEWLKDYKGVIVTDFFAGYDSLQIKHQKCLIHLIRDLNDDLFNNPFDEKYKQLVVAFGNLLKKIVITIDRYGLKKSHLKKHIKDTNHFYKNFLEKEFKSDHLMKYIKRLKKHWNELWTFLEYDGIPWNNNNAEAGIKAFVQHRRNVNGQFNDNGLKDYLSMLTIAQTCRYRNISFLDFMRREKGIWHNVHKNVLPADFLPFQQAKLFIRRLKLTNKRAWYKWVEENKRPVFIPSDPSEFYKNDGWKNWEDWFS